MILETINSPEDLKRLTLSELNQLAKEIRTYILNVLSQSAGHFASNLGTIELTIALHRVFDAPKDKIIWDVGHQAYAHKILTGRREQFPTIRQYGGLCGFPSRFESEYDVFGGGHASTSIAAALGMAIARDLRKAEGERRKVEVKSNNSEFRVVAVIGDGGMTGGMAYETLNAAGDMKKDIIVVLNDNQMSISPTVGAFSKYFNKIRTHPAYNLLRGGTRELISMISRDATEMAHRIDSLISGGPLFRELGFRYFGPIDGHDIEIMLEIFEGVKTLRTPVLIHVITQKGKGYRFAEENPEKYHGVSGGFDPTTGKSLKAKSETPTYSTVFGDTLIKLAKENPKIIAITAAMCDGTGLDKFKNIFPARYFDVGIAEQCAVTMAAGIAAQGMKPVVAIYSTFLQRAYDQIVHDVCLQNLPVVFALDRGGLVGADGPTHHGAFDFCYLRHIPNIVVMAPKDENELQQMVKTAIEDNDGPIAFRYPRGSGEGVPLSMEGQEESLPIGKGELLKEGDDILLVAIGNRVYPALEAASTLAEKGVSAAVVNARFVKPLDEDLILTLAARIRNIITIEDNSIMGGFGSAVLEAIAERGLNNITVRRLGIPDKFVEHGDPKTLYQLCGYDTDSIVRTALELVSGGQNSPCPEG
ncbi:1-deoxy-D-xylulose-5-phosphate synthase [Candidatus Poribacteria bacterium]|nr:1-deoxy-D-xylulose-5-phosphate synthase [Candidatus Poribacteria bacterium]